MGIVNYVKNMFENMTQIEAFIETVREILGNETEHNSVFYTPRTLSQSFPQIIRVMETKTGEKIPPEDYEWIVRLITLMEDYGESRIWDR